MKWFYIIAIVLSVGLALSPLAYLPRLGGGHGDSYAGKSVRYDSYPDDIKSIDPATCGDVLSAMVQGNFYEAPYAYHYLKRPPTVIPQLAAAMPTISPDGLTYTIHFKPGVKYSRNICFGREADGTLGTRTVRAEDFILAFKRIADYHITTGLAFAFLTERVVGIDDYRAKTKTYKADDFSRYDLPVAGLRAVDELTLEIRLTQPFPQLTLVLAINSYAPIPSEAVDYWLAGPGRAAGQDAEFRRREQVVGTGPYLLSRFVRKGNIIMERNPDFRYETYPAEGEPGDREEGLLKDAGERVPFIDVLHYSYVPEAYSTWMLFLTEQSDASGIPKEVFASVVTPSRKLSREWESRGIRLKQYAQPSVYWLAFNMDDPVLKASKSLRQALCACFDVDSYSKVLFNGRAYRATNIIPSGFAGHDEAGPGPYYKLDMDLAKRKLADAKVELAAAGQLVNGRMPTLTLSMVAGEAGGRLQAEFIQQQFSKLGVTVKIDSMDWSTLQEKVNNKQCQIYTMGWHADYADAENFLQCFYGGNIANGTNNCNYNNPDFNRMYEQARVMNESPERMKLYVDMTRMVSEDVPVLLLSEPLSMALFYDWLQNVKPHPIGYGFARFQRIDAQLRQKMGGR